MNLKSLPLTIVTAILCALPLSALAADAQGELYCYTFELTEGRSCDGSSKLKPEELNRALAQLSTSGGFLQLEHYRTASGTGTVVSLTEATVGFVNPHYIVRFHLIPATPTPSAKPSQP